MGVWVYVSSGGVRGGVSAKMCERVHAAGALDGEIPEDDNGQQEDEGDEEDAIVRALRQRMQQVCTEREGDGEGEGA